MAGLGIRPALFTTPHHPLGKPIPQPRLRFVPAMERAKNIGEAVVSGRIQR